MALKRVVNLTEGPMDYVRGATSQLKQAAQQVHQAGRAQSLAGNLDKAVKALAMLMKNVASGEKPTAPNYNQQGAQRVQAQGTTQQMPVRPQMTFSSYLQSTEGDQLNELDGFLGSMRDKLVDKINKYAERPSKMRDFANAGVDAAREYQAKNQSQQIQQQIQAIRQLASQFPDKTAAAKRIAAGLRYYLGADRAQQVYTMLFSQTQQQQPAIPAQKTSTSWQQGQPTQQQPAPQKRQYGPGRRRPRPQ